MAAIKKTIGSIVSGLKESSSIFLTLKLVWSASKKLSIAWFALLCIQGILPLGSIFLAEELVNQFVAVLGAEEGSDRNALVTQLFFTASGFAGLLLVSELLRSCGEWVRTAQAEMVRDHISARIQLKASELDLAFYDSPDYHDKLHQAMSEGGFRSLALLQNTGNLLQNSILLVALGAALIPRAWWLPLALLASALPAFWVLIRFNHFHHRWWEESTEDRRWSQYFDEQLTGRSAAAELRLFKLGEHFRSAYQDVRKNLRDGQLRLIRNHALARLVASLAGLGVTAAVLAWVGWSALQAGSTISLGAVEFYRQSFTRGQNALKALLGELGQLYKNVLFLRALFDFFEIKRQIKDAPETQEAPQVVEHSIRINNLSFRYPGTDNWVLENFSMEIPANQMVAIVGPNGAGKSTLIKLLCRFYDPQEGSIEIDGIDYRKIPLAQLHELVTVLFQDPISYQASAEENITMGDRDRELDHDAILTAAKRAGAHEVIERLPQGYDSMIGREFAQGVDLSLGEHQRLALARAFYRKAPLLILDEPTSFMDSWAETRWLEDYKREASDRCSLMITHRFTTAKLADRIYVMDRGEIIETGNHQELLSQDGLYAQSWNEQTKATH